MRAWDYPHQIVVVRCDECGREGKFSKQAFIKKVGKSTPLSQALNIIARDCAKSHKTKDLLKDHCKVRFPDLIKEKVPT